jgi:hypothetical protein
MWVCMYVHMYIWKLIYCLQRIKEHSLRTFSETSPVYDDDDNDDDNDNNDDDDNNDA